MASGPNPVEVYEGADKLLVATFGGVNVGQLGSSTPCTDWNVQNLITHNLKVQRYLHSMFTDGSMEMAEMFSVDDDLPQEGAEASLKSVTDQVVSVANNKDLSAVIATPLGEMPAGHFMMFPLVDLVVHRWDLASATGQNKAIDSSMAEVCLGALGPDALEGGRQMGAFGPEVVIPSTGSVQDRLLGAVGRTP
jgi:uncharacterized protein (TIGR03086 family)